MTQRGEGPESVDLDGPQGGGAGPGFLAALALGAVARRPWLMHFDGEGASEAQAGTLKAFASIVGGEASGEKGSATLGFTPGTRARAESVELPAGVPASALLSAALLPLAMSPAQSTLIVRGATHLSGSPTFHDLAFGLGPMLERFGLASELSLESAAFAGESSGAVRARVFPAPRLKGIEVTSRGVLVEVQALACIANVGIGLAMQLEKRASERLRARGIAATVEALPMPSDRARGLAFIIAAQFERTRISLSSVGGEGRSPDELVDDAVNRFEALLGRRGALDGRLAADLVAPAALAASAFGAPGAIGPDARSRSRFSTSEVTAELLEAAAVARALLDVDVKILGMPGEDGVIDVRPRA